MSSSFQILISKCEKTKALNIYIFILLSYRPRFGITKALVTYKRYVNLRKNYMAVRYDYPKSCALVERVSGSYLQ